MGALCVLLLALAVPVGAQETPTKDPQSELRLQRNFELPAHRGLMDRIAEPDTPLAPFVTDGCSGGLSSSWAVVADLFPDFAEAHSDRPPWESCCVTHDRAYHDAAGTHEAADSYDARLAADQALRACVITGGSAREAELAQRYGVTQAQVRHAYRAIGEAMFSAVRFGGGPCTGLPWRWGFGYPNCLPSLN